MMSQKLCMGKSHVMQFIHTETSAGISMNRCTHALMLFVFMDSYIYVIQQAVMYNLIIDPSFSVHIIYIHPFSTHGALCSATLDHMVSSTCGYSALNIANIELNSN